jgi:hypothetical protein
MYKLISLLLIAAISSITVFAQSDSTTNIPKVWKLKKECIDAVAEYRYEVFKKDNPAMADQVTLDMVKQILPMFTYEYKKDGTYEFVSPQRTDAGKWKLSDDKKFIITISDETGKEVKRPILRISATLFSIRLDENVVADYIPVE